ncbi:30S ribosomal protein S17 [Candidatus Kaiserbacteria bacterium CG10_big_fil_rev_8_21_14_0_10_59_10]|uniref:Small ribosomal subunit protein uS17 n=1 Tax=Candidatus Kaiserbacteria bacterium CG10_big_fil_rev_8_21_14_0_10_59_10 TaxID=1974612 RepID=A0A2H0U8S7_9BACT|nr:MAG: 30S ribosomal protein S17 [Candidatus Kaiserbacteria bacterium CG10_big_fil_rev_8_21_14_0_10_59_10]
MAEKHTSAKGKVLRGTVVKAAMKDTVTVAVERYEQHPKYKKYMRKTKKYLVHDAGNTASVGDTVSIREIRPMSKRKHFTIAERISSAAEA